jgi:hypothetical protein
VEFLLLVAHIAPMRSKIALACLTAMLAGCAGGLASYEPPAEPAPNYREIIAKNLMSPRLTPVITTKPTDAATDSFFDDKGNIFLDPKKIGLVEIADSQRREVSTIGWAWMTCIRLSGGETNGTYAIFVSGGAIVEARRSVLTDRCEEFNYQPLDLKPLETNRPIKKRRGERSQ